MNGPKCVSGFSQRLQCFFVFLICPHHLATLAPIADVRGVVAGRQETVSTPPSSVCPAELDRWWWWRWWVTAAGRVPAAVYRRPSLLSWFHRSQHQKEQLSEYKARSVVVIFNLWFAFCCHEAKDIRCCPSCHIESICVICPWMNLFTCSSLDYKLGNMRNSH